MAHVKSCDTGRDVWKASGAAALDGEEGREVGREKGDDEKKKTEETKVGSVCNMAKSPLLASVKTGRLVFCFCFYFLTEAFALLRFQVYFLLHEREGAGGDGCFAPHPGCWQPRRGSARRPQGGAVSLSLFFLFLKELDSV